MASSLVMAALLYDQEDSSPPAPASVQPPPPPAQEPRACCVRRLYQQVVNTVFGTAAPRGAAPQDYLEEDKAEAVPAAEEVEKAGCLEEEDTNPGDASEATPSETEEVGHVEKKEPDPSDAPEEKTEDETAATSDVLSKGEDVKADLAAVVVGEVKKRRRRRRKAQHWPGEETHSPKKLTPSAQMPGPLPVFASPPPELAAMYCVPPCTPMMPHFAKPGTDPQWPYSQGYMMPSPLPPTWAPPMLPPMWMMPEAPWLFPYNGNSAGWSRPPPAKTGRTWPPKPR